MTELEIVPSMADRFAHILSAIDAVQQELHGISEDALAKDRMRRLALERLFEIISVASVHIPARISKPSRMTSIGKPSPT